MDTRQRLPAHFDPIRSHRSYGVPDRYEFVPNRTANYVNVFDLKTRLRTQRITVGHRPDVTATTIDGRLLFVASAEGLAVIELSSLEVVRTCFGDGIGPNYALNVFPDGDRVFLHNYDGSIVVLHHASSPHLLGVETVIRINEPALPDSAVGGKGHFTADGKLYVNANWHADTVFALDLAAGYAVMPLVTTGVSRPDDLVMTLDDQVAYVASYGRGESLGAVHVIDMATGRVVHTLAVGRHPAGLTMSPDGRTVYVTNVPDGSISAVDTATHQVMYTASAAACYREAGIMGDHLDIEGVSISPDGRTLYAYAVNYGALVIFDDLGVTNSPSLLAGGPS